MKNRYLYIIVLGLQLVSFTGGAYLYKHDYISRFLCNFRQCAEYDGHFTILDYDRELIKNVVPRFAVNLNDYDRSAKKLKKKLEELLCISCFDKNPGYQVNRISSDIYNGIIREYYRFELEKGLFTNLYFLTNQDKSVTKPTILVLHGHGSGSIELIGGYKTYQNEIALFLAQKGFNTVTFDMRGFGGLGFKGVANDPFHHGDIKAGLLLGRPLVGGLIHDAIKVIDYLETRDDVDMNNIGVIGTSMAGNLAVWLGAFDTRLKLVVSSAAFNNDKCGYLEELSRLSTSPLITDFFIPGILTVADFPDIVGLFAPKPVLFDFDPSEQICFSDSLVEIEKIYNFFNLPENLNLNKHNNGHTNSPEFIYKWVSSVMYQNH